MIQHENGDSLLENQERKRNRVEDDKEARTRDVIPHSANNSRPENEHQLAGRPRQENGRREDRHAGDSSKQVLKDAKDSSGRRGQRLDLKVDKSKPDHSINVLGGNKDRSREKFHDRLKEEAHRGVQHQSRGTNDIARRSHARVETVSHRTDITIERSRNRDNTSEDLRLLTCKRLKSDVTSSRDGRREETAGTRQDRNEPARRDHESRNVGPVAGDRRDQRDSKAASSQGRDEPFRNGADLYYRRERGRSKSDVSTHHSGRGDRGIDKLHETTRFTSASGGDRRRKRGETPPGGGKREKRHDGLALQKSSHRRSEGKAPNTVEVRLSEKVVIGRDEKVHLLSSSVRKDILSSQQNSGLGADAEPPRKQPRRSEGSSPEVEEGEASPGMGKGEGSAGARGDVHLPSSIPDSDNSAWSEDVRAGQVVESPHSKRQRGGRYGEEVDRPGFQRGLGTPSNINISSCRWAAEDVSPGAGLTESVDGERVIASFKTTPESGELSDESGSGEGGTKKLSFAKSNGPGAPERDGSPSRGGSEMGVRIGLAPMHSPSHSLDLGAGEDDGEIRDEGTSLTAPVRLQRSMLSGCRSVNQFKRLEVLGEGVYGVVYKAQDEQSGEVVALKGVKMEREREREGFPVTALREIQILVSLHHPSIVDVREVVVGDTIDRIYLVMEYMEHDLKGVLEAQREPFAPSEVKCVMCQLLQGIDFLHRNWVLHRDLKTSNLLMSNRGEVKICDFGLSRQYGQPLRPYTQPVVTLWYRAPELLLGVKEYSSAIDMWSLGCIMGEVLSRKPLFQGESEIDQVGKIFQVLRTPTEELWPGFSKLPGVSRVKFPTQVQCTLREKFPALSVGGRAALSEAGYDLLLRLLTYDPSQRITAEEALNHRWFREEPLPKQPEDMPSFPVLGEKERRRRRTQRSPDPLKEQQRREQMQQKSGSTGGLFS